jgi:isocitrate dehydrogenase kinase/phosphatase
MSIEHNIARTILDGFNRHYHLFREISAHARRRFERADWEAVKKSNRIRIDMYDQRVVEAVEAVLTRFPAAKNDEALWPHVKREFISLLYDHKQPDCAETFYNSVACRVLDRTYYRNKFLFWRPAVSTEHMEGDQPTYRCYYPAAVGLRATLYQMARDVAVHAPWENLRRDIGYVVRAIREHFPEPRELHKNFQINVLSSLFYRNKAAYMVGRIINGNHENPFALPILRNARGELYLNALLLRPADVSAIFSLARAYFMVDMEVPSAYVSFLSSIMPGKSKAELYTAVGLQKQGKTLFYRDMNEHLKHSTDRFVVAPGTRGMVMMVFTLPSFPYVFKVIRDWFDPPKDTSERQVKQKYLIVKHHDRVGRMADTLEYTSVALPAARFDPALLAELERLCPSKLEKDGDLLVIKHCYIERRMTPLDVWLHGANEERVHHGVREFGRAIREMAAAGIFPGDLLLKNFGVTRWGRVVFYDYDEICYLHEVNFRRMPVARDYDDEVSGEPWFSVGPDDVFPEEFPTFLFPPGKLRELFMKYHGDLATPEWWSRRQEEIKGGAFVDLYPYPDDTRFSICYGPPRPERPEARP